MPAKARESKFKLTQREFNRVRKELKERHTDLFWQIGQRTLVDREPPSAVAADVGKSRQYVNASIKSIVLAHYQNTPVWFVHRRYKTSDGDSGEHTILVNADSRNNALALAKHAAVPYPDKTFGRWVRPSAWTISQINDRCPTLSASEFVAAVDKAPKTFKPADVDALRLIIIKNESILSIAKQYKLEYVALRQAVSNVYLYHFFKRPQWRINRIYWTNDPGYNYAHDPVIVEDVDTPTKAKELAKYMPVSDKAQADFRKWTSLKRWSITMID
ncbi:MAG: hypothetical protein KZQ66_04280 [Candidatus Thiodiazotropha sp. (ex Lucinoma aequizonata)]|nr:hypothetical protein [Candidatus Thiodiazotropha sp. (ex Lucinoma aequizonata)]MCU7889066.1 hypothetical protein [Candidatus Thiodiazotropha sp. (ex Lucinoma aequizonata)]MCU7897082.1 hypothetical protein [Candidatus Thiodiazotropha sp. (ex Lucinoma aequizonata)]MCU7900090.1 hypothetical protein [Candidatus Thiodiazotropha sp. (ex Lucinoma aequizonata)]MCU7901309.1 hypothetical protein [Candidatus Thiodiazotropha sp. (ex Lucinoma aequizonata)]